MLWLFQELIFLLIFTNSEFISVWQLISGGAICGWDPVLEPQRWACSAIFPCSNKGTFQPSGVTHGMSSMWKGEEQFVVWLLWQTIRSPHQGWHGLPDLDPRVELVPARCIQHRADGLTRGKHRQGFPTIVSVIRRFRSLENGEWVTSPDFCFEQSFWPEHENGLGFFFFL